MRKKVGVGSRSSPWTQGTLRWATALTSRATGTSSWGVLTNEVNNPGPALLAQTGGTNILFWMRNTMGIELDPHSHENDGYNYADVAYLHTQVGVTPLARRGRARL